MLKRERERVKEEGKWNVEGSIRKREQEKERERKRETKKEKENTYPACIGPKQITTGRFHKINKRGKREGKGKGKQK